MTELAPLPETEGLTGAGFWIRAGARLIDTAYGFFLSFSGGILAGICMAILSREGLLAPDWHNRLVGFNAVAFGLSLVASLLYQAITEGLHGASLGKLMFQLRVVTEDVRPITMMQALKRNIAYWWDSLFFGLIAYSKMRESDLNQRNGDHWAHTVVVRNKDVPASSRRGVEVFVLALLMGSAVIVFLHVLGLILQAR